MQNKFLVFILFLFISIGSYSQTYIAPFYGYGSSYLYPSYNLITLAVQGYDPYLYNFLHHNERDFSTPVYFYKNNLYGIKFNQNLTKRLELNLECSFSATKQIPMSVGDLLISVSPFGYNKYCFLLNLTYYPFKYIYISAGPGAEKIKINPKYSPTVYSTLVRYDCAKITQLNYNIAVGGIYKNFFCELKFIDGFTNIEGNDLLFYPISSFYAILGYRLKIYPIKNKKKVDCPKF